MHILLINYEFPPLGGGAGNATQHIAAELAAMGEAVTVLTARFADLPHNEIHDDYRIIRVRSLRRAADRSNMVEMIAFMLSSMAQVIRLNRKIRFDVTLAFFGIPGAPPAYVLRRWAGVPYFVSLRGGDVPGTEDYSRLIQAMTRPFIKFLWRSSAGVIANSAGLASLAQKTAPDLPVQVIPNGVDTQRFCPGDPAPPETFLFAGRFSAQKNLLDVVKAVAMLPPDLIAQIKITLVGDGPLFPAIQSAIAEANLQTQFSLPGWVERDAMPALYRQHSCFILNSHYEGMPNVVLEAMACGLPIIMTDIPGSHELVRENGWIIPRNAPQELTDLLADLLQNPQKLTEKSALSRQHAESFSWQRVAADYHKLFQAAKPESAAQ